MNRHRIEGPAGAQPKDCERILGSLPEGYGIESALVDYARDATIHGQGTGLALHRHAETWHQARGARVLQGKTLSDDHPSVAYARTRPFYERLGYALCRCSRICGVRRCRCCNW